MSELLSIWAILVATSKSGNGGPKPGAQRELQQPFFFQKKCPYEQAEINQGSHGVK